MLILDVPMLHLHAGLHLGRLCIARLPSREPKIRIQTTSLPQNEHSFKKDDKMEFYSLLDFVNADVN